jgi:hypothetical protein
MLVVLSSCSKPNYLAHFKQYNPDAHLKVARESPEFKTFLTTPIYVDRGNKYIEVHIKYMTNKKNVKKTMGVFKYTGKLISIFNER